ncbi:hypothetical protein H6G33_04220 [Calothrix sp. FACHB-1219]|uniref:hypothetical protein n=1 Tax=unclassified Calothrix TaxID=2619626 RepID=UPI00168987A7|nr:MULTISPECIES: hypothetical protein [unclassified Calothrix]MBD2204941.1 hypothetical protein [Calothrix sp. FACHB-168]MBD2216234.1 hypothetical protein [Calothrix sp. FACHB-1219]
MSASGTISNLQQALNCAGKCDCCANLQQQINQINARLAQIKPVDEQAIINKSVDASRAIVPDITKAVVATSLIPIFDDITWLKNAVGTALTLAKEALFLVGNLIKEVAMIAATMAAALGAAATLQAITGRIDAVEAGLDQANNFISQLFSQVKAVKNTAEGADSKAEKAIKSVDNNTESIVRLSGEVSETKSLARTALSRAVEADRKADVAKTFAERAAEIANIGIRKADTAQAFAERAAEIANIANKKADTANNRLDNVEPLLDLVNQAVMDHTGQIISLNNEQLNLRLELEQVSGKVSNLEFQIPGIDAKANQAIQKATNAEQEAEAANTKAQAAILENAKLRTKINQLEQKDVILERGITKAQQEAYAALQLGGLGLVTAQNTAQGLSNVAGRVGIIGGTAVNADSKATNALGQISTIKNGVVTNPAIQNAIAQPIGRINDTQQKQQEQIKQIEQKISTPGANTVTRGEFEQIKQKLGEADKMNREGNAKIDEILAKLPALPAAVASATAARVPSVPQIKQAVGSAMCESANSGCVAGALNNQSNGLKADFGQKLRDLEQGLNAGANAAQLTLLNTINTKLGDQVVGGIGRVVTKITTNQAVNQIANLVTMAAAMHNVIMLSDGAAQTFFSILDNIFAIPTLIINPEAETISTQQVFGGAIENVMKSVFGVEEWAQIKAQWAIYNRIYQSSANVVNNVRSIGGSIVSAVEQSARLTGKGFNAMQDEGLLSENNWDYTPENLKLKGGLYAKFGKLADGISVVTEGLQAIEAVTSEIRSAVDSANQIKQESKEIEDAIKEAIGQSKTERETAIEALPPKEYSWEDLI